MAEKKLNVKIDDDPTTKAAAASMMFDPEKEVAPKEMRKDFADVPPEVVEVSDKDEDEAAQPLPRNMLDGFTTKLNFEFADRTFLKKWHPHVFNEEGPRIHQAQASGYEFVKYNEVVGNWNTVTDSNGDPGSNVRVYVGSNVRGHPMYGYLMKKPMHIHEAHRAEYDARVDRIANALKEGDANRQPNDGRYTQGTAPTKSGIPQIKYDIETIMRARQT